MPGTRGQNERTHLIQLRVTQAERDRWRAYVQARGGYVSAFIRRAVHEYIRTHQDTGRRESFYD